MALYISLKGSALPAPTWGTEVRALDALLVRKMALTAAAHIMDEMRARLHARPTIWPLQPPLTSAEATFVGVQQPDALRFRRQSFAAFRALAENVFGRLPEQEHHQEWDGRISTIEELILRSADIDASQSAAWLLELNALIVTHNAVDVPVPLPLPLPNYSATPNASSRLFVGCPLASSARPALMAIMSDVLYLLADEIATKSIELRITLALANKRLATNKFSEEDTPSMTTTAPNVSTQLSPLHGATGGSKASVGTRPTTKQGKGTDKSATRDKSTADVSGAEGSLGGLRAGEAELRPIQFGKTIEEWRSFSPDRRRREEVYCKLFYAEVRALVGPAMQTMQQGPTNAAKKKRRFRR